VAAQMHEQLVLFRQAAREGRLAQMPPLPDDLLQCWE
jgi:hypothetical protein